MGQTTKQSSANTAREYVARMLQKGRKANRLIDEASPYLLQHAFNPVQWYPWGDEAFALAQKQNKPIFLSIGYSTCHWCHVMARESFENIDVAELLNKYFICIKVDREERPDIDQLYMTVTQKMTGGGGWPMSLFLTPDLKPFYAGTYFPPQSRYGRPGFADLIKSIHQAWLTKQSQVTEQANEVIKSIQSEVDRSVSSTVLNLEATEIAAQQFISLYDKRYGGFGPAPKFPRPVVFDFLLRHSWPTESDRLQMVYESLRKMAKGGIYDHLGGGFHRYSVDAEWRVPHFEKMLYDQAQLVCVYLDGFLGSHDLFLKKIAVETLDYILREMTDVKGGFFSAEDADSPLPENPAQHGEGAYYLWSEDQIRQLLNKDDADLFIMFYGVQQNGNALADPHGDFAQKNILYQAKSLQSVGAELGFDVNVIGKRLDVSRQKIFTKRLQRPRPLLDDKILSGWNGLMISALAQGSLVLGDERYLKAALQAANFVCAVMIAEGRLLHRYRDGKAGLEAQLSDYAFLIKGFLDLYEASLQERWLVKAIELTDKQIELFADRDGGGFFDSSGLDSSVLVRMKDDYDGAEPAASSVAAFNFIRLSWLFDSSEYLDIAQNVISSFGYQLGRSPTAMPAMLSAMKAAKVNPVRIIIAGREGAVDTKKMHQVVGEYYLPHKVIVFSAANGPKDPIIKKKLAYAKEMAMLDNRATAYICQGVTCQQPTSDLEEVRTILSAQHIN